MFKQRRKNQYKSNIVKFPSGISPEQSLLNNFLIAYVDNLSKVGFGMEKNISVMHAIRIAGETVDKMME